MPSATEAYSSHELEHLWSMSNLLKLARHGLPRIVEGVLAPLGLFYLFLALTGVSGAIWAALGWSYSAVALRLVLRRPVPGLLVLAALATTARTALAFVAKSSFVYFLQPSLATAGLGVVFLASAVAGQPLAQRLASDFVLLPHTLMAHPAIKRVFVQITLLWAATNLISATGAVVLLVSTPIATYMAAKTCLGAALTALAVVASTLLFKRAVQSRARHLTLLATP